MQGVTHGPLPEGALATLAHREDHAFLREHLEAEKNRRRPCRERLVCSDLWMTPGQARPIQRRRTMTTSITTFLTYDTQAEDAAKLYTLLFDGRIKETMRYPAGGPRPEGAGRSKEPDAPSPRMS